MKKIPLYLGIVLLLLSVILAGCKPALPVQTAENGVVAAEESSIDKEGATDSLEDLDTLDELDKELEEDLLADLEDVQLE